MEAILPVRDPVLVIAIVASLIVVAPLVLERWRLPGMVGILLAGALLGPYALGVLERDRSIELLGTMGLLYILFTAALEIDLAVLMRTKLRSISFGALSFGIPMLVGVVMARYVFGFGWPASILLASLLGSHTLLAYPVISRLGLAKNPAVTTGLGGTIITDAGALLVLAVVAGSAQGELTGAFWAQLLVSITVFVLIVLLLLPRFARWFFRTIRPDGISEFAFVLSAVFGSASLARAAGVEPIVGAFMAGLALNRCLPKGSPLVNRIHFTGNAFFIPFFLLSVGMLLDVRVFASGLRSWLVAGGMVLAVGVTKYAAAAITGRIFGFNRDETFMLFGLTLAQAAATLASVMVGFKLGIFDTTVLNGAIVMMLVTCTVAPWLADRHGRVLALAARAEAESGEGPAQRILVSLSNPDTAEPLMDLALVLRDPALSQPVYPLSILRDGPTAAESVLYAEKMLAKAVVHLTAADVPAQPVTRIDVNIAAALRRVRTELRATDVIMGWSGRPKAQERFFGGFLDHILDDREHALWVARLVHPLNTMTRILFVLPPNAAREPGFARAASAVKILARQIGATLVVWVERAEAEAVSQRIRRLKPSGEHQIRKLDAWSGVVPALAEEANGLDLVVLYGTSEGSLAFTPGLARLPRQVGARLPAVNTVVVYPADLGPAAPSVTGTHQRPAASKTFLRPECIVTDLDPRPAEEALTHLLSRVPDLSETYRAAWLSHLPELVQPLDPGVVLIHDTLAGLAQTSLLLGVSPAGLQIPGTGGTRTHLVFILLHPKDHDAQLHLDILAEIARRVHSPDIIESVCAAASPAEAWAALYGEPAPLPAEPLAEIPDGPARTAKLAPVTGEAALVPPPKSGEPPKP